MGHVLKKTIKWGGTDLTIETGKIAKQADGAVLITYGETTLLCTAVAQKTRKEGVDFFPLTAIYREMSFAAGKIPGGFFKREGKPSEKEVLTSRLIDRPIRPSFHEHFNNETQIICTVLSYDMKNDPDIIALIGASAALSISGIPFTQPIAASRVGYIDGNFVLNTQSEQNAHSKLDLVVAGTKDSVLMVESQASELSEETMLEAVKFGHQQFQVVIDLINEIKSEVGKEIWAVEDKTDHTLDKNVYKIVQADLKKAYAEKNKSLRTQLLAQMKDSAIGHFKDNENFSEQAIKASIKNAELNYVRTMVVDEKKRIDGRGLSDVRKITCETEILPRTHGSALFTRGETQVLAVTTLGSHMDEQLIDALEGESKQSFMLHYNFPPYSVGEASQLKPPGRREIGHGKLALRGLSAVLPGKDVFPYTIRVVAEVTESNGSSSMATVCSSSLSLMQAGVPLKTAVAGIAMGLVKEGNKEIILSDIMGDEDHLGDMDFKVAGTSTGVTALQMDIKITGISFETMEKALAQAKEGRLHILSEMNKVLDKPLTQVNKYAPVICTIKISPDKIREVIGTGGKVIRGLCEETGSKIEIEDDGTVKIASPNSDISELTIRKIMEIAVEPEVGTSYSGTVIKITDFGAFVRFLGAKEGLVHISEIKDERIENISDVLSEGDVVKVKLIGFDPRGKIKLSMRVIDQVTGEDINSDSQGSTKKSSDKKPGNKGTKPTPQDAKHKNHPPRDSAAPKPYKANHNKEAEASAPAAPSNGEKRKYYN
jgi:polyribonucleotide nucleotidyltransferase